MNENTREQIRAILIGCVNGVFRRMAESRSYRPFHEALLSKEVIKASAFERSFSTSFGQGPVEQISRILANDNGGEAERQKETMVNIYKGALDQIERILSDLRNGSRTPNWKNEIKTILAFNRGETEVRRVLSDLYIKKNDKEIFISIKTVKPNLDQTEIAKRDLFLLKANNPNCETYFGLFYNPDGPNREDYSWLIPSKLFDMRKDECVLIGKDYWDMIGGDGSYEELLLIFAEVGEITIERLKNYSSV
ncbi:MAG: TdeIII family type II restriction endonuclease [Spirochaetae bacterium HGW-Spirochaetae-8]|jgi:hypothetical protein|nr:MAG: TdeIII family type II restriction endonuclease [Spirochaetae bacterium HGW-Spirochaetae-8]